MQNQTSQKPRKISSGIVSITASLNLLVILFVGFIFFYAYGNADPSGDNINLETFLIQKEHAELTIGLFTLFLIIIYLTALVLWLRGKRLSDTFLLTITLLHAFGAILIRDIWFPILVIGSLILDVITLALILLEKRYSIVILRSDKNVLR